MSTKKAYGIILCLYLFVASSILAQSTYQFGILPSVNLNSKLKKDWSLNFKAESRQSLLEGSLNEAIHSRYKYLLTDFSFIAAKKIGLNSRISSGYLLRFREGKIIHRTIQQYTTIQRLSHLRLAHRIVTDQTFSNIIEYRLRYRITAEIPLNGQSADIKEFYIKINNEYLNSIQGPEYDIEIRLVPLLGYAITVHHKVEFGLDYRINSFLTQFPRHSIWTSLNWFIEI